jgi:hypothetical protein
MSRTHFGEVGSTGVPESATDASNVRFARSGAFVGNYVTIRLTCRAAVAANQSTPLLVDRFPMPMGFRVSQVCFDALGTTATANLRVSQTAIDGSTRTDITAATAVSAGTPKIITPGNLVNTSPGQIGRFNTPRDISVGETLDLFADTDGTGAIPAGGANAWVTGRFVEHCNLSAPLAVRGQMRSESPVAGFYDAWPLITERVNANQAARFECNIIAPYDARLMGIYFDGRNLTTTTGAIAVNVLHVSGSAGLLSADLDGDANLANNSFWADTASSPSILNRDITKGETIALRLATGASDSVPIGGIEATLLVWCKGHVRDVNVEPTVED